MTHNQRFETRKNGAAGKTRTLAFKTARATKYATTSTDTTNGL